MKGYHHLKKSSKKCLEPILLISFLHVLDAEMTRQEPHYKKKWKGMAESTMDYGRPEDETNCITSKNYNKLWLDSPFHPSQERKPETSSLLKLTLREQSLSSNVERVCEKINNSQILNHSSLNSAFQPVGPKQKG